jgi:hypothetical protein
MKNLELHKQLVDLANHIVFNEVSDDVVAKLKENLKSSGLLIETEVIAEVEMELKQEIEKPAKRK